MRLTAAFTVVGRRRQWIRQMQPLVRLGATLLLPLCMASTSAAVPVVYDIDETASSLTIADESMYQTFSLLIGTQALKHRGGRLLTRAQLKWERQFVQITLTFVQVTRSPESL